MINVQDFRMIEEAETYLMAKGFRAVRVRKHGDIGRIEINRSDRKMFLDEQLMDEVSQKLKGIGFKYVTMELTGYERGWHGCMTGQIRALLASVKNGETDMDKAVKQLSELPFKDLGFASIDNHREIRVGYPEVIYCEGKTVEHVRDIVAYMLEKDSNILATRANDEIYEAIRKLTPDARYNKLGRTVTVKKRELPVPDSYIAIVCAGTSDLPVVEEAKETAEILGNKVKMVADVGVAGLHRLFAKMDVIGGAKVIVVAAGMEGALASVIGGLVDKPVIAVPTSVGYGANFSGLAALLGMLNSCASGVSVVNIDNGFGAAYQASMINHL